MKSARTSDNGGGDTTLNRVLAGGMADRWMLVAYAPLTVVKVCVWLWRICGRNLGRL